MKTFRDAEVRLAETLPGYESRTEQQAMAVAVEAAIEGRRHAVIEAGCGTGKSLAYLIPAVLSGRRTVISTATKALQDQIANKDIPFLLEHLGVPFTAAVLKGRSNYLCVNKFLDADHADVPHRAEITELIEVEGFLGERESFPFEIDYREWAQIAADTDDCSANECSNNGNCFAQKAKTRAAAANIVVVNHALFFTDMVVREMSGGVASLLGEFAVVIFDEAHEAEEYASNVLGSQFTEAGLRNLVGEIRNWAHRVTGEQADAAFQAGLRVTDAMTTLWTVLVPGRIRQITLLEAQEQYLGLVEALQGLHAAVTAVDLEMVALTDRPKLKRSKDRIQRKVASMAQRFVDIIAADFADLVRWVEAEKMRNGVERMVIKSSPINVGKILRQQLFEAGPTAILTSATMLVNGNADYIASRLGLDEYDMLDVGTPFDFAKQAILYVPAHLPDADAKNRVRWESMSMAEIGTLVRVSNGRALLLFTSNKQMRSTYEMLSPTLPYTCLMQGQAANKVLAERFMEDTHSVLFATRSFFTGVDFQGEACSLVVMDKLPFPVPSEPIFEARCDAIKAAGGNDFMEYTVPLMSLTLKQGFGRLIRHREDRGVVAILDPRLLTKPYGKVILNSLPPARRATKPEEITDAFQEFAGV